MSEDLTPQPLTPEMELQRAQERLDQARQRVAEANAARIASAQAELKAFEARQETERAAAKAAAEAAEAKWVEINRKKREDEARAEAAERKRKAQLEAEIAKREEEARIAAEHTEKLRRLAELAFQEEQAALQIQNEAIASAQRAKEFQEQTGVVLSPDDEYRNHPLRKFIAVTDICAPNKPATPAPVQAEKPAVSRRKSKVEVDYSASGDLESLLRKELHLNVSTTKLDALASTFTYDSLMEAAHEAVARAKVHPTSCDALLVLIEAMADGRVAIHPIVGGSNG